MNSFFSFFVILAALAMAVSAGAQATIPPDTQVKSADCPTQKISTHDFEAYLRPVRSDSGNGWIAFRLIVRNKTMKPLTIDWDDTYYLQGTQPNGKFKFQGEGLGGEGRGEETIQPGMIVSRVLWPEANLHSGGPGAGLRASPMQSGEQGVRLVLKTDGVEFRENLALNVDNQMLACGIRS